MLYAFFDGAGGSIGGRCARGRLLRRERRAWHRCARARHRGEQARARGAAPGHGMGGRGSGRAPAARDHRVRRHARRADRLRPRRRRARRRLGHPAAAATGDPITEDQLVDFFGAVADAAPLPVAIQNAPQYIGVGLSSAGLDRLSRDHPNVRLLKAEGSAVETRALIELTEGRMAVFQGRGGMEFIDVMRAGCVGMIPSVESCHVQSRMFELMQTGRADDEAEAERLYAHLAPLIVFLMQSVGQFLCYGKRLTARRLGLAEVHDRQPAQAPTAFGLDCLARHAAVLDQPETTLARKRALGFTPLTSARMAATSTPSRVSARTGTGATAGPGQRLARAHASLRTRTTPNPARPPACVCQLRLETRRELRTALASCSLPALDQMINAVRGRTLPPTELFPAPIAPPIFPLDRR